MDVRKEYFEWMCSIVCKGRFAKENSFRDLLSYLHSVEYRWTMERDEDRAEDGEQGLRWRFAYENHVNIHHELDGPCTVLEMMIALASRCEEIMDDASVGDRTGQWFWKMINSLGLSGMTDRRYDYDYVDETIQRFLDRDFAPDGRGGLFTIRDCEQDLRDVDTWTIMLWYLNTIT